MGFRYLINGLLILLTLCQLLLFKDIAAQNSINITTYSDSIARTVMWPLTVSPHSDDVLTCLSNNLGDLGVVSEVEIFDVPCNLTSLPFDNATCRAVTGVLHYYGAVFIAFRGTVGGQIVDENNGWYPEPFNCTDTITCGSVNHYFHIAFEDLWANGVGENYMSKITNYSTYQTWVLGHSLAGALASLCATRISAMQLTPKELLMLMTMGKPRVGQDNYANMSNLLVPNSYRLVNSIDLVPHMPPYGFFSFKHEETEIFYPVGMACPDPLGTGFCIPIYTVCGRYETPTCSLALENLIYNLTNINPNITGIPHVTYFNIPMDQYLSQGCLYDGADLKKIDSKTQKSGCPDGFQSMKSNAGKCVKYVRGNYSFPEAQTVCQSLHSNSTLASISSEAENEEMYSIAFNAYPGMIGFWIGLRNLSNTLTWMDGASVTYTSLVPSNITVPDG